MRDADDPPLLIEHRAKSGEILEFDISRSACEPYGFYYSDRVDTPLGHAGVVGVRDRCLWFLIDGDTGASFWDNGNSYVDLLSIGISLVTAERASDKRGYKVKTITFKNKNIPIVLQNENGPCPLIGISNVLALRGDIVIEGEGPNKNVVTLETIIEKLSDYLFTANIEKGNEALQIVDKATKLMPRLETGLDVNFNFKEFDTFEKTEQCKLLEQFNIRLAHGWLVDPEDLQAKAIIGDNTYNDLMNKLVALDPVHSSQTSSNNSQPPQTSSNNSQPSQSMEVSQAANPAPNPAANEPPPKPPTEEDFHEGEIIKAFLSSTQSQLTNAGLEVLHRSIKEVCLLRADQIGCWDLTPKILYGCLDSKKLIRLTKFVLFDLFPQINGDQRVDVIKNALKIEVVHWFAQGELCIFFRNNHFSTLTKQDGKLYILVTDIGYERERNIVWDLLSTVCTLTTFSEKSTEDWKRIRDPTEILRPNPASDLTWTFS